MCVYIYIYMYIYIYIYIYSPFTPVLKMGSLEYLHTTRPCVHWGEGMRFQVEIHFCDFWCVTFCHETGRWRRPGPCGGSLGGTPCLTPLV